MRVGVDVAVGGVPVGVKVTQAEPTQAAPRCAVQLPQLASWEQKVPQSQHARTVGVTVGVAVIVGVTVGVNVAQAVPRQTAPGTDAQAPQLPTGCCMQNGPQLQHSSAVGVVVFVRVAVPVGVGVGVFVDVGVEVLVGVGVAVLVDVGVTVGVFVRVGVGVDVGVGVFVKVAVGVFVGVGVDVPVEVTVLVGVAVLVGVLLLVEVAVGVNAAQAIPPTQAAPAIGGQLPQFPCGCCMQNVPQLQHSDTVGVMVGVVVMVGVGVIVGVRVLVGVTVAVKVAQATPPVQRAPEIGGQLPQFPTGCCMQNVPQLQHSDGTVGVMVPVCVTLGV